MKSNFKTPQYRNWSQIVHINYHNVLCKIEKEINFKIPPSLFDCSNSCLFRHNKCHDYYTTFGL